MSDRKWWLTGYDWCLIFHTPDKSFFLRPPWHVPYFSERYRIKCSVYRLPFGWRFQIKKKGDPESRPSICLTPTS